MVKKQIEEFDVGRLAHLALDPQLFWNLRKRIFVEIELTFDFQHETREILEKEIKQ